MSINEDLPFKVSLTEGVDRTLELFTNRYSFIRLLAERLNEEKPAKEIIFLYGEGGNGKTLLLNYLNKEICKKLLSKQWRQIRSRSDVDLSRTLVKWPWTECENIPSLLLDFDSQRPGNLGLRDPVYGPLILRSRLREIRVRDFRFNFPLFDFVCIIYFRKTGKSIEEIRKLFPVSEAGSIVGIIINLLTESPAGSVSKIVLDRYLKKTSEFLTTEFAKSQARTILEEVLKLDEKGLISELPKFLASDLNSQMSKSNAPSRLVLFFDSHETLWGEQFKLSRREDFRKDEWLRRLFRELKLEDGIVAVVAGREIPSWSKAGSIIPRTEIPEQYLSCIKVGHLAFSDARAYLQKVGISDEELQDNLLAYASVNPLAGPEAREVHPLHLGLCCDVVLEARDSGQTLAAEDFAVIPEFATKGHRLIERLLCHLTEDLRYAVDALSACRAFDEETFQLLGSRLNFVADSPTFRRLTNFSFVWKAKQQGENWYRIHDLVRRFDTEPQVKQAHQVLAEHYQEQNNVEAIFHINRLNSSQGIDLWTDAFRKALHLSRYESCRLLLDLRNDLMIEDPLALGVVSEFEGRYLQELSHYAAAQQKFSESIRAYDTELVRNPEDTVTLDFKGDSLQELAGIQEKLAQYQEAKKTYKGSLELYNAVLQLNPNNVLVLSKKGTTLQRLAELLTTLSEHEAALKNYEAAIAVHDAALKHDQNNAGLLGSKGLSLRSLADLQVKLSQHEAALKNYEASVKTHDAALKLIPSDARELTGKGVVLWKLADLQVELSQYEAALKNYEASVKTHDAVLKLAPDNVLVLGNKGSTLQKLAALQSTCSEYEKALNNYEASIAVHNVNLQYAPDDVVAFNNKGNTLALLADLQSTRSEYEAALRNYKASITTYDAVLKLAPDYVWAFSGKGSSLKRLADLQSTRSEYEAALENYEASIKNYDAALKLAPDYFEAFNGKGVALSGLAGLQSTQSEYEAALENYKASIIIYDDVLKLTPDNLRVISNKGGSLRRLADLQSTRSEYEEALKNYEASIEASNAVLQVAPNDVGALNKKGLSQYGLANLQAKLSRPEMAMKNYQDSIAAYDMALQYAPENAGILNNKGGALRDFGLFLLLQGKTNNLMEQALYIWEHCLELTPGNIQILENRNQLVSRLESMIGTVRQNIPEILEEHPSELNALLEKGDILIILACLQTALSQTEEAKKSHTVAISTYETALMLSPENLLCLTNISDSYLYLALLLQKTLPEVAEANARESLKFLEQALQLDPQNITLLDRRDWLNRLLE